MTRLLRAELRRLLARRAVVVLLLVGVAFTTVATAGLLWTQRPLTDAEAATAQTRLDRVMKPSSLERIERDIAQCEKAPARFAGPGFRCEDLRPQLKEFADRSVLEPRTVRGALLPSITFVLALLALLAGTTYVGAEYASGSMSNLLLFEARRTRVWAAKTGAVAATVALYAAALLAVAVAVTLTAAVAWSDPPWSGTRSWYAAYAVVRGVVVVVAAGVVGVVGTLALRSTVATVGLTLGYALVGETSVRGALPQVQQWLVGNQLLSFLRGRLVIRDYSDFSGRGRPDTTVLHLQTSAYYLGALMLVLLVVSLLTFRRRDLA